MASTSKIQSKIAEIISKPHNVRFEEIKWVMDQLGASGRAAKHGHLFCLNSQRVMINQHNDGRGTVPQYSVDDFRDFLIDLGLYEIE